MLGRLPPPAWDYGRSPQLKVVSPQLNMAWAGEIRKSEMNNFKRHQQHHLTKVTIYSSSNLQIHHKLL